MQQIENIINIPGDGNCLFWALALGYLEPVKTNKKLFVTRYEKLFGQDSKEVIEQINNIILNYDKKDTNWLLETILKEKINVFRENLVNFIETKSKKAKYLDIIKSELSVLYNPTISNDVVNNHLQKMKKPHEYAGNLEIKFATEYLGTLIKVYMVNDKNEYQNTHILSLKETKNKETINTIEITNKNDDHFQLINTFSNSKQNTLTNNIPNISNNNTPNISKSLLTKKPQVKFNKESNFILETRTKIEQALKLNKSLTANEIKETTNIYINSFKKNELQSKKWLPIILNDIKKQVETYNEVEAMKTQINSLEKTQINSPDMLSKQSTNQSPTIRAPFIK